jgi:glucose/arabinose dehydrogenase
MVAARERNARPSRDRMLVATVLVPVAAPPADAAVPDGFADETVFAGLTHPTVVRFSPDGRVFVAEKSGLIKVFDGLTDATPDTFADLRTQVHNFWDRGLLGLVLHPQFPTDPRVYVLYTYDAPPARPRRTGERQGRPPTRAPTRREPPRMAASSRATCRC